MEKIHFFMDGVKVIQKKDISFVVKGNRDKKIEGVFIERKSNKFFFLGKYSKKISFLEYELIISDPPPKEATHHEPIPCNLIRFAAWGGGPKPV